MLWFIKVQLWKVQLLQTASLSQLLENRKDAAVWSKGEISRDIKLF